MANAKGSVITHKDLPKPYQVLVYDYVVADDGTITKKRVSLGYYSRKRTAETELNAAAKKYPRPITFKFVYDAYMKHKKDAPQKVLKEHRYAFKKLEAIHDIEMNKITVDELKSEVAKTETHCIRKKVRLMLSQLYKYGVSQNVVERDITPDFKLEEITNKHIPYQNAFTEQELELISSDNYDDKTYDIIQLLIKTGIKTYSLFNIKNSDIDFMNNKINIHESKKITKEIKFNDEIMAIVFKYYDYNNEYLFNNHLGKQLEYTVFRRYGWIPFMKHYNLDHQPQDCHATYLKYGGEKMAKVKRANGNGGIAYRQEKNKPYVVQISVIVDGKSKRKIVGSYKSLKEAQKVLEEYNASTVKTDKLKYGYTFKDVYDKWIEYRTDIGRAKNPTKDYLCSFNAVPELHDLIFAEITYNQLFQAINKCGKNAPTLKKIIMMFHQMYKFAMGEKIVPVDVSANIKIGAHSELNQNPNRIVHSSFTSEEIKELLSDKDNKSMVDVFKFMIYTGVRTHEFLTLTKDAINFDNRTIHIKKEFSKTNYSERFIPIHPDIYDMVLEKYNDCKEGDEPLFKTDKGLPFQSWNFRNTYWKPFMELHNLSSHYPHDTRYTFSTFWDYCHLDTRDGEVILGHSSKSDITRLYKTPDMIHRYKQLCKLTFDIQDEADIQVLFENEDKIENVVPKKIDYDDIDVGRDDFIKTKEEMTRLGFKSFQEYNDYLEFINSRKKNPPEM